jgi:hypothetical protein
MRNLKFSKQSDLIDFFRILKPGIIIGKYMRAVLPGHFIQCPGTPLGENDGIRCTDGGEILFIWLPPGADDVLIGFK